MPDETTQAAPDPDAQTRAVQAPDEQTRVVRDYVESVFRRGREPMEPVGFTPDWEDQPSRYKTFLGVERFGLPRGTGLPLASAAQVLLGSPPQGVRDSVWTPESLAALLRLSYGILDRRLRVSWNQDSDVRVLYPESLWGRGAASGGGMYPLEIYWVAGSGSPVTPGVYHYSTAHHGFERLLAGDVTGQVRAACEGAGDSDGYLLVTVRFWKNSFKYNSFCYHVVTQDAGALLGCWELLARGMGKPLRRAFWFDDERLNHLLGVDTAEESVLAVVPVPFTRTRTGGTGGTGVFGVTGVTDTAGATGTGTAGAVETAGVTGTVGTAGTVGVFGPGCGVLVDRPSFERSARTLTFEQVQQVHQAVLADPHERPGTAQLRRLVPRVPAGGGGIALPEPLKERMGRDAGEVMRSRRTSFGSFVGSHRLGLDELGTVLAGTMSGQDYLSDANPPGAGLTGLYVLANRVDALPCGAYRYDRTGHRLQVLQERPLAEYLQRSYYLSNYNLDQAGAVLAISGRWESTLRTCGSRGYRVLNAEVGALAQTAYVAAAALGVGCGVVLGFDNIAIDEAVGLDGTDERTFLFVLLGHERQDRADFDYRLL